MQKAKPFFEHACHKCGVIEETRFSISGKHLKQMCGNCGFYVKFFDQNLFPTVHEIKSKIWFITEQDLSVINSAKKQCEFNEGEGTGLYRRLEYWKLYLQIRKISANA